MRPIARQSARLAGSSRCRECSIPRRRAPQQQRAFHNSTYHYSESRPPNGHTGEHTPASERRDAQKKGENAGGKTDQLTEQDNAEVRTANDGRKARLKSTLRQQRINDVPKPPPVPDWFLKHNVRLVEERSGSRADVSAAKAIRCVDAETGHTLFTVPFDVPSLLELHRNNPNVVEASETRNLEKLSREDQTRQEAASSANSSLDKHFFDQKYQNLDDRATKSVSEELQPSEAVLIAKPSSDRVKKSAIPPSLSEPTDFPKVAVVLGSLPWQGMFHQGLEMPFLEAQTGIRAAFAIAEGGERPSAFVADRVDLSLQCPDPNSHSAMDVFVKDLAYILDADTVHLDANDFADLTNEYVGYGNDEPGSYSNLGYEVFDGYTATSLPSKSSLTSKQMEEDEENEMDEEEEDEEDHDAAFGNESGAEPGTFSSLGELRKALQDGRNGFAKALSGRVFSIGVGVRQPGRSTGPGRQSPRAYNNADTSETTRDEARLTALLESLLDAPKEKRATPSLAKKTSVEEESNYESAVERPTDRAWRRPEHGLWMSGVARLMTKYVGDSVRALGGRDQMSLRLATGPAIPPQDPTTSHDSAHPRTIVHVRELRDISNSRLGESIIHRLVKVVRKRRRSGEEIIVVGTTAQDVPGPFALPGDNFDPFPFRTINIPPIWTLNTKERFDFDTQQPALSQKTLVKPAYRRILEINLRHLQSMIRRLRPDDQCDLMSKSAETQMDLPGMHFITERVLTQDQVQRLVLTAIAVSKSHAQADTVKPIHIALAAWVTTQSDHLLQSWSTFSERREGKKIRDELKSSEEKAHSKTEDNEARIARLKKSCNQHESRLLSGMVDPQNIKTSFTDVHAPSETIDALKTLTTLSLLRPDAFKYGVLASDRLPGLLLYGPPGTGKTLLAKAVAKESKATVLEISGAQIYEKYVGEGEKMVRAVFSLAKKLSPCVVFIDEADAIFGSRSQSGNRNTHREIINQFLREWDGMDDHSVFMMVASNRPFDLDDAVLRRLPRRLLVDLPVAKDRESILSIHLRHETLDPSVSLNKLAEQTPLYSGSDLKNLAVATALACVREENESAEGHKSDQEFKLPEKRTLMPRHFEKALAEISASISEDMSSLSAVRKFDEQFGDRKGRKKKSAYGFGSADAVVDENAARVRQPSSPPASSPPPP